ncbi:YhcN/YlaJ family sporulation lipoprotein [Gorillibacterium massiliense]|uniref:YhcN/YlaJ family sporulation lipoprotein n=1 Tax=Gorillibacterium massiliense TaxID=1280390 RepID=UPI0004AFBBF9|nr:YhcN/YlaJ family sporulation lipoprotein [Gorillibacterium massiliense]
MSYKKRILTAFFAALALFTLVGCAARAPKAAPNTSANNMSVRQAANNGQATPHLSMKQHSEHLVDIALSVPQVKGASCLRLGNLALVGIDVPGNLDRSRVDTIKYTVAEALKKDPQGAGAIVTADVDLAQRIREISDQVKAGHPLAGFANELGDILGRLIPQLPQSPNS